MLSFLPLLAAFDPRGDVIQAQRPPDGFRMDLTDTVLVLGAIVVIAALLFFWAFYIRKRPTDKNGIPGLVKPRPRSRSRRSSSSHSPEPSEEESDGDPRRVRVRRRRRRHHPDNYPRNPTLGETGGLPPARPEDSPEPPPQPQ